MHLTQKYNIIRECSRCSVIMLMLCTLYTRRISVTIGATMSVSLRSHLTISLFRVQCENCNVRFTAHSFHLPLHFFKVGDAIHIGFTTGPSPCCKRLLMRTAILKFSLSFKCCLESSSTFKIHIRIPRLFIRTTDRNLKRWIYSRKLSCSFRINILRILTLVHRGCRRHCSPFPFWRLGTLAEWTSAHIPALSVRALK